MSTEMISRLKRAIGTLSLAAATCFTSAALAQEVYDDGLSVAYDQALKGKTVAFVPISLSFDIPQAYNIAMQRQAEKIGYNYIVRDPNFSVEQAVQAVDQLIAEKPDVIVVQPLDAQAFNRVAKKANAAGIRWIWANVKSATNGDAYVGGNHYLESRLQVKLAAKSCGEGTSKKIAIMQVLPNVQSNIVAMQGTADELKNFPDLQIVASQSADADATKANAIARTILKQHPDLCAFIGFWDGEDVGIPPAIEEAGLKGKVAVITTGSGNKPNACDKIMDGSYTGYVSYDLRDSVQDLNTVIRILLQLQLEPGSKPFAVYNHPKVLTKDSLTSSSCWTMDELSKPLD